MIAFRTAPFGKGDSVIPQRSQVVLPITGDLDVAGATAAFKQLLGLDIRPGDQLVLDLSDQAGDHARGHGRDFTRYAVTGRPCPAGVTSAENAISTKAAIWTTSSTPPASASPKTTMPPVMTVTFAAVLVQAMTGTASPS